MNERVSDFLFYFQYPEVGQTRVEPPLPLDGNSSGLLGSSVGYGSTQPQATWSVSIEIYPSVVYMMYIHLMWADISYKGRPGTVGSPSWRLAKNVNPMALSTAGPNLELLEESEQSIYWPNTTDCYDIHTTYVTCQFI